MTHNGGMLNLRTTRELTEADLAAERKETKPTPIAKLRARHHQLARNIASGMKQSEAAIIAGMTDSRVSILLGDPMFNQLVRMYQAQADEVFLSMKEKMAALGEDVVDHLAERFESNPDDFTVKEQTELLRLLADRTGHGPTNTGGATVNINLGIADKMEAARKRLKDVTPIEATAE